MYQIKLDDDNDLFSLYDNGTFICRQTWIGQHLLNIGNYHGVDLSKCHSESHMMSILEQHIDIEVVD